MDVHAQATPHGGRRVYIIDDLLGAILLLAAGALVLLLDLTRRQICAVYQLAFALCAASAFFVVGGLIDHHLSNDQLSLALYGSYLSSGLTTSYVYLPVLASVVVSLAFLVSVSTCSCDCCCLFGAQSASHQRCFAARIRANASLYACGLAWLYVAIGTRLNVRLRESAINPVGGTVHWTLLRSPFFLAMAHIGSLLLVALKIFLQHADRSPTTLSQQQHQQQHHRRDPSPSSMDDLFSNSKGLSPASYPPGSATTPGNNLTSAAAAAAATAATVQELMRPPPLKNMPQAPRRSTELKSALPRSPQATAITIKESPRLGARHAGKATTPASRAARRASSSSSNNNQPQNDGDVSSLISSDSDSDDSVLRPSLAGSVGAAATGGGAGSTLPPRHAQQMVRRRPSGGASSVASGYSSSPPSSPTPSTASTGSSFSTTRPRALTTRAAAMAATQGAAATATRPRLSSNGSSSSTTFLSDSEEHVLSGSDYGAEYSSDRPTGVRRRATALGASAMRRGSSAPSVSTPGVSYLNTPQQHVPLTTGMATTATAASEWIECLDDASGSLYYYNSRTGESRWKADH